MLWKFLSSTVGSVIDQLRFWGSAAFLSDSIIRETITGRYLNQRFTIWAEHMSETEDLHDDSAYCDNERHNEDVCAQNRPVTTYGAVRSCSVSWEGTH